MDKFSIEENRAVVIAQQNQKIKINKTYIKLIYINSKHAPCLLNYKKRILAITRSSHSFTFPVIEFKRRTQERNDSYTYITELIC
jgi:hypothetical protein